VTKPRQSLEELFLEIVERAKAEQVATSGATAGGETASFLKGAEAGDQLIAGLVNASREEPRAVQAAEAVVPAKPTGPDADVIGDLLNASAARGPEAQAPAEPAKPLPTQGVDLSVIGSLIEKPDAGGEKKA
jgi:hypothetical protein